jgi:hypothetical protein
VRLSSVPINFSVRQPIQTIGVKISSAGTASVREQDRGSTPSAHVQAVQSNCSPVLTIHSALDGVGAWMQYSPHRAKTADPGECARRLCYRHQPPSGPQPTTTHHPLSTVSVAFHRASEPLQVSAGSPHDSPSASYSRPERLTMLGARHTRRLPGATLCLRRECAARGAAKPAQAAQLAFLIISSGSAPATRLVEE